MKRAQGILKDILAGRKVRATGATREDVPFEIPEVQPGTLPVNCVTSALKAPDPSIRHMKTHTGETGWSCDQCGKVLASRAMYDLHLQGCGKEKGHWCRECRRGYTTKQALVAT